LVTVITRPVPVDPIQIRTADAPDDQIPTGAAIISKMVRVLTCISLATLLCGVLALATAFRLGHAHGSGRYYHSASRHLFTIGALTGMAATVLIIVP
jgi:hypothetical protein